MLPGRLTYPMRKSVDGGQTWVELSAGTNLHPWPSIPRLPSGSMLGLRRPLALNRRGPHLGAPTGRSVLVLYRLPHLSRLRRRVADGHSRLHERRGSGAIIQSTNAGADWELLTPIDPGPWWISALATNPLSPTQVYFGEREAFGAATMAARPGTPRPPAWRT